MTRRIEQEVKKEIEECYQKYKELFEKSWCYKTMRWKNISNIDEMNQITRHISNLYLELNKIKFRKWDKYKNK